MELHKFEFKKKELLKLDENERFFIFQAGTIFNEINILSKVAMLSYDRKLLEIENRALQLTQTYFFHLLLIGKLFECWQFLQRAYFTGLSKKYEPSLSDEAKNVLKN